MRQISAQLVQELRKRTGAGMMACKTVLQQTDCDLDKAVEVLRKQGIAKAESRETRTAAEGRIGSYVHHNGKMAAMVEVNCETDFVARTDVFQELVRYLAEHVAAAAPLAVEWSDIPLAVVAERRGVFERQVRASGKPEGMIEKIVAGKLEAWAGDVVLLRQAWIREPKKVIGDVVSEYSARLGEAVRVKRFERFSVGEEADSSDES
jgi:elongation factor Ts